MGFAMMGVRLLEENFPQNREGENPLGDVPWMSYNFCIALSPNEERHLNSFLIPSFRAQKVRV